MTDTVFNVDGSGFQLFTNLPIHQDFETVSINRRVFMLVFTPQNMDHYKQKSERLSVLSDLEEFAFYGFPDFDDEQRLNYFIFEDKELALVLQCSSVHTQVI